MSEPEIYVKVGNQPEIKLTDKITGLSYLGMDDSGSSPQVVNNYQQLAAVDGQQFISESYDKRTMNEKFSLDFMDYEDLQLAKHKLYNLLFGSRQLIRIRHSTNMAKVYFAYPMTADVAPISPGANVATFTIPFENPSGYWFSIFRSDTVKDFNGGGTGYGMNYLGNNPGDYHFNSMNFIVYNPSDVAIDPYYQHHDMKVLIRFSGSKCKIKNTTNNSSLEITKSQSGVITYDGVNCYVDNNNINNDTDFGTITLERGNNNFQITECSSVDITFSFPFIYLY